MLGNVSKLLISFPVAYLNGSGAKNTPQTCSPGSGSSGIMGGIRNILRISSWLGSPFTPTLERGQPEAATAISEDDAMVIDTELRLQVSQPVVKGDSLLTETTHSSQEYEWDPLSEEAFDTALAQSEIWPPVVPSSVSRETSGSSLGKRPRSNSLDGQPVGKKRTYRGANDDENPFLVPRTVPEEDSSRVIIAQPPLDLRRDVEALPWGVQWEIARLVSIGVTSYMDSREHLPKLTGTNEVAVAKMTALFRTAIRRGRSESAQKAPWAELDREEDALNADTMAGLGFNHSQGAGWYGGRVQFIARLKEREKGNGKTHFLPYEVSLLKPELGPSNRFARRFGSRRFIRVRIPKNITGTGNQLIEYFKKPFLLNHRVFRAFSAKDNNVFLVESDEGPRESSKAKISRSVPPLTFLDFVKHHNPLELNNKQAMAKWGARFALGLSNSVPGLRIPTKNIHYIEDIVADWKGEGKPPAELIHTDGCGYINMHGLQRLQLRLKWEKLPTAVQFRFAGAKGLLLLHPDVPGSDEPHIWLRPSQIKISYENLANLDPSQVIVDVLRPSRLKYPARLSAETIVNIAHNQSHASSEERHKALCSLMRDGLDDFLSGFMRWADPNLKGGALPDEENQALRLLWHEISRAGGVMSSRMSREFSDSSRARGLLSRWNEQENDEEEASANQVEDSVNGRDLVNLSSLEETAMRLLDAGFKPTHPFLNDKVRRIVKKVTENHTQRYRIDVPGSVEVFCVPDPKGVLKVGEVFLKSSRAIFPGPGEMLLDVLVGEVLLSTDVRKVLAVDKHELHQYTDVIIFPVEGEHSLASELAGGDCDGDTISVFPYEALVKYFVNADITLSRPPEDLESNFEKEANETAEHFQNRISDLAIEAQIREYQTVLLASLNDSAVVGSYSIWHDNAVYSYGYDHPDTRRLAFMFTTSLDGSKSGLRVKTNVYKADKKKWDRRGPLWKEIEEPLTNENPLTRGESLEKFIMDDLKALGEKLSHKVHLKFQERAPVDKSIDNDLRRPWIDAEAAAEKALKSGCTMLRNELKLIAVHVESVRDKYSDTWQRQLSPSKTRRPVSPRSRGKRSQSTNSMSVRINGEIALDYANGPHDLILIHGMQLEQLKASYAYILSTENGKSSPFVFNVAFREILGLKAAAAGCVSVAQSFYNVFDLQSGIKALSRRI
ncbi:hypothetical protein K439DRAFT_1618397 [Ramaria rubella]|nr:hypothetical protein K439DRAFT_1618397 [Ramaria rubella]